MKLFLRLNCIEGNYLSFFLFLSLILPLSSPFLFPSPSLPRSSPSLSTTSPLLSHSFFLPLFGVSLPLSLLFLSFSLLSSFLSLPSLLSSPALSPLLVSSLAFSFSISLWRREFHREPLFPPLLFLSPANFSLSRDGNNFRRERSFLSQFLSLPVSLSRRRISVARRTSPPYSPARARALQKEGEISPPSPFLSPLLLSSFFPGFFSLFLSLSRARSLSLSLSLGSFSRDGNFRRQENFLSVFLSFSLSSPRSLATEIISVARGVLSLPRNFFLSSPPCSPAHARARVTGEVGDLSLSSSPLLLFSLSSTSLVSPVLSSSSSLLHLSRFSLLISLPQPRARRGPLRACILRDQETRDRREKGEGRREERWARRKEWGERRETNILSLVFLVF